MSPSVLAALLVTQTCGGLAPILTKLALGGLGPWSVVVTRQLLGVVVLFAMARAAGMRSRPRVPFTRRERALLLTLSWAGFALPQILLAHGIARSTGTNGALLSPLEPIGILVGGALFLGERLTPWRLLAVALGTAGASAIVLQGDVRPELGDPLGDALIALGHLAWAIYTLAAKPLLERHDPGRISLWLRIRLSRFRNDRSASCRGDTLALTVRRRGDGRSACHAATCAQAVSSTHRPSGTMSPVSSASSMNSPGGISPRVGWRQRTSAS